MTGRKEKNFTNKKTKKLVFYLAIIAFPILQFLVFYVGVNINSILLAFKDFDVLSGNYVYAGFENFAKIFDELFGSKILLPMLGNSLLVLAISLVIGTVLPVFISYYLYKKRLGYKFFKVMLMLPSIISSFALVLSYRHFIETAIPEIVEMLTGKKIMGLLTNLNAALIPVLFYSFWFGLGTSFLLYLSTMMSISESVIEAAKMDGATPFIELTRIVIPQVFSTYVTYVVMTLATTFTNQANLYNFFANDAYPALQNIAYYLYRKQVLIDTTQYPYLAAFGVLCSATVLPLCFGVKYLLEKLGPSND